MPQDNDPMYHNGEQLLAAFGCKTREEKLECAVIALMRELNDAHIYHHGESLEDNLTTTSQFCSCADAYRMGHEALKT